METQVNPITGLPNGTEKTESLTLNVTGLPTIQEVERQYLNLVLKSTGGNKVQAAKILGVSVKTIYNKLDGYKANETVRNSPQGS